MSGLQPDPGVVGRALPPPFVRLPRPGELFRQRAQRFAALATQHDLGPYLDFLAAIASAQDAILPSLQPVEGAAEAEVRRAAENGLPPLPRAMLRPYATIAATMDALFDRLAAVAMPGEAAAALETMRHAGAEARARAVGDVLDGAIPMDSLAGHGFVAAALQVHYARLAAGLPAAVLKPVGDGLCPACGASPVSSLVVGWPGAENARYCACWLCATQWNAVRVKCTACGSTEGIGFQEVEGGDGTVKAECCDACGSYLKVLYQVRSPSLDPVADDVASLALDILLRDSRYRRSGFNPFLLGA